MKSNSATETKEFGELLGARLTPGAIVGLIGDLGSGKTTLIKGIVSTLCHETAHRIISPTFNYVHTYGGKIHHFDLYRLKSVEDFLSRGLSDYFETTSICCIEWPEKIVSLLPANTLFVEITYVEKDAREIVTWEKR